MSVIFSRAPLRISLGGGGTDLPSYYSEHGGFLVSGAIDKYVYMLTHTVFQRRYRMKYSETGGGRRDQPDPPPDPARDAAAPLARQPAGDRLGGRRARRDRAWAPRAPTPSVCSRAWRTPAAPRSRPVRSPRRRARSRSTCSASRSASRIPTSPLTAGSAPTRSTRTAASTSSRSSSRRRRLRRLRDQLLLFYTGEARSASKVLADQDERSKAGDRADAREPAPHQGARADAAASCCAAGDLEGYAELMHEHWEHKRQPLAGHGRRAHRPALHARPAQRRDRRQAGRRRRRRVSARLRAPARGHPAGDGRGRAPRSWRSTSSSTARTPASTHEPALRVAIVGCGLIGAKRAAALAPRGRAARVLRHQRARRAQSARRAAIGATACATLEELLASSARTSSSCATSTISSRGSPSGRSQAGAHVLVEKPAGVSSAQIDRLIECQRSQPGGSSRSVSTTAFTPASRAPPRRSTPGVTASSMYLRARYGHGGRPGYDREWRADPARSGGGELIDQGMHLLDLSHWLAGPAGAALGAAAHALLGHAGRGQRGADPR